MKTFHSAGAVALAIVLSGCGKSEDPRPLVLSLFTGVAPDAETATVISPTGRFDFSVRATTGDDYAVELTKKQSDKPEAYKFSIGKANAPCDYKMNFSVNGSAPATVELDFTKFEGIGYGVPFPAPMLKFGKCGIKVNGDCRKDPQPIIFVEGSDQQKALLESSAKKMREEICKPT